jgi:hypothetical protein
MGSSDRMDRLSPRFFRAIALGGGVFVALLAALNVLVDPYLLFDSPRVRGVNAAKPAADARERMIKAYDAPRKRPRTLLLGSSRVDWGLDAQHPAWPEHDRPVYNLGLVGAGPYVLYEYIRHVSARQRLTLVVLGLDFEYFLATVEAAHPADPEFESRLAVGADGGPSLVQRRQYFRDLIQATLSLEAASDSVATLVGNWGVTSVDFAAGNRDISPTFKQFAQLGSLPVVAALDLISIRSYEGKPRNPFAMKDVRAILDLCRMQSTQVVLFISPVHADKLEIMDLLGSWSEFEDWKRDLTALTAQYVRAGSQVTLWDFSGYDSYSTETVPLDHHVLHWFWDSSHYTRALGDVMVRRMLSTGEGGFGVVITPGNIESHLAAIRDARHRYRESHPVDRQRVLQLHATAVANRVEN